MIAQNICLDFQLHYFIAGEVPHAMDAKIHNEAERYLLKAICELQKYVTCEISVRVEAKNEGGIIDNLLLVCEKLDISETLTALLAGFVGSFFRPAIHKTDEVKNRVEVAEKIKNGKFSQEEIEVLLKGDKQLKKWVSKYYDTLSKENTITKIETKILFEEPQENITTTIEKKDFNGHVIQEGASVTTEIIEGTTIYIVSPVLVKSRRLLWKGLYSGCPIEFKIEDNDFLSQVYDHEIKFGNGTSITCSLQIETKTTIKDGIEDIKSYYRVKAVSQWADSEHFQYETKKYKKMKKGQNQPVQLSLFGDEIFE
ncbi:MAG: hypothetical protein SOZ18_06300 [Phocaeicola sp.]|nr:hypothetical protein [Phocaeicola sp.]